MSKTYFSDCVSWPADLVDCPGGLCDCIGDAEDITLQEFIAEVGLEEANHLARMLGYGRALKEPAETDDLDIPVVTSPFSLEEDYHVSYKRSMLLGRSVVYCAHSAIEHVFIQTGWSPSAADVDWAVDLDDVDEQDYETPSFSI